MAAQSPMEEMNNQIMKMINDRIASMAVPSPLPTNTYRVFEDKQSHIRMVLRNVDQVSGCDPVGEPDTFDGCLAKVNNYKINYPNVQYQANEYKLTQQSLDVLLNEGVPATTVEALKPLMGQEFADDDSFITAIASVIGTKQAEWYKCLILGESSRGKAKQSSQVK